MTTWQIYGGKYPNPTVRDKLLKYYQILRLTQKSHVTLYCDNLVFTWLFN